MTRHPHQVLIHTTEADLRLQYDVEQLNNTLMTIVHGNGWKGKTPVVIQSRLERLEEDCHVINASIRNEIRSINNKINEVDIEMMKTKQKESLLMLESQRRRIRILESKSQ